MYASGRFADYMGTRILLVDDDVSLLELYAGILICSSYNVDTAEDGAAAWKSLNDHSYDLLITDNQMPRVTGLELIKKLRSQEMAMSVMLGVGNDVTDGGNFNNTRGCNLTPHCQNLLPSSSYWTP